jgi:hypothetical protein
VELQTSLVNHHIDDLQQTAREVRAGSGSGAAGGSLRTLRRNIGWRLVSLGLALVSHGQPTDRPLIRMA